MEGPGVGERDIRIVLVEPRHPGNVGAAARAMKTMGLDRLSLVRPAEFPSLEAEQRAVSAADVLEAAHVCDTVREAIADCGLVIGTAGRARQHAPPLLDARGAAAKIVAEAAAGASVAILFGSERDGLSNADLESCAFQLTIPTGEALGSLNLAAAVQLVGYEVFMAAREEMAARETAVESGETAGRDIAWQETAGGAAPSVEGPPPRATHEELELFFTKLRAALDGREFFDAENPEPTFKRIRRIFGRARPSSDELHLLHGLVRLIGAECTHPDPGPTRR